MYLQAFECYCAKFPEVEYKKEAFDNVSDKENVRLELFLVYTYWFFNEYHTHSMHSYGFGYDEKGYESLENDRSIACIWEELIFQIDFYYTFRKYTKYFKNRSYKEFEAYSSTKGMALAGVMG